MEQSILKNVIRNGNFTSSKIHKLASNGKAKGAVGAPFNDYIKEKNMERLLGRSIETETDAYAFTWGKLIERRVFDILPIEYCLCSNETIEHRRIKCWVGSPDARKDNLVGDVKGPITLKSFCQLVAPIYLGLEGMDGINHVRDNHNDGEKYFWQLVSNGCICEAELGELIVYAPYLSELPALRELAREMNDPAYNWIIKATDDELPYLIDGGFYKNLNVVAFPLTDFDKNFLTERVELAEQSLVKRPEVYTKLLL